jgi:biotin operon repressor
MPKVQKMPAILFYTGDWLKDPAVRMMTLTQRGLWIDMLALMYESTDRGYLALKNGQPVSIEQLCRMVGCKEEIVEECLESMEAVGVFSRTKDGVIYSRRMVNDEKIRESKAKAGRASGKVRNNKRTEVEHNGNKDEAPLEYEYENEVEVVIDTPPVNSSERYVNRTSVTTAWESVPTNRRKYRKKFSTNWIEHIIRENVDENMVKEMLGTYYESDEGKGKYHRSPHRLIEDEFWKEDKTIWGEDNGEVKFPYSFFDHERIVLKYRDASEENNEKYETFYVEHKQRGMEDSQIITKIAFKIWQKYPEHR